MQGVRRGRSDPPWFLSSQRIGLNSQAWGQSEVDCIPRRVWPIMISRDLLSPSWASSLITTLAPWYPPGASDMSRSALCLLKLLQWIRTERWSMSPRELWTLSQKFVLYFISHCKPWPHHPASLTRGGYTTSPNRPLGILGILLSQTP